MSWVTFHLAGDWRGVRTCCRSEAAGGPQGERREQEPDALVLPNAGNFAAVELLALERRWGLGCWRRWACFEVHGEQRWAWAVPCTRDFKSREKASGLNGPEMELNGGPALLSHLLSPSFHPGCQLIPFPALGPSYHQEFLEI